MADNDSTELERGPASIRAFILRALELLARDLLEKADRNGGLLNTSEIDAAAEEFKRSHAAAIGGISAAAWEECGVIFDSEQRGEDRKSSFERLMVRPFEHLLPPVGEPGEPGKTISRRVIQGYLAAMLEMIGPMIFGRHQERCRELVRIVRGARGAAFSWDDVYADTASQGIVDDIMADVAQQFTDFKKQRDRFIGLVNDAMPASGNGTGAGKVFDKKDFSALMKALYASLGKEISAAGGEDRLSERYGAEKLARIKGFLGELDEG